MITDRKKHLMILLSCVIDFLGHLLSLMDVLRSDCLGKIVPSCLVIRDLVWTQVSCGAIDRSLHDDSVVSFGF